MSLRENEVIKAVQFEAVSVVADDANGEINSIPSGVKTVKVTGVTNGANDWIVLPPLASVQSGHEITILCKASSNFEMRTPGGNEAINAQDSDGTKEYLCTDTEVIKVVKISDAVGWMAHAYSALGAVVTAVVPD